MESSFKKRKLTREEVLGEKLEELFQKNNLLPEDQSLVRQIIREWDNNPADKRSLSKIRGHPRKNSIVQVLGKIIQEYSAKIKTGNNDFF